MSLPDKRQGMEEAIARIPNGARILISGFGVPGTPFTLIQELLRQGQTGLTLVKNDANETGLGIDHLLASGQVERLITTHIGLNPRAIELMNSGKLTVEFCGQGMLAERLHAGGAGLKAFLTDIGVGTLLAQGKPHHELDGQSLVLETALRADFALIHATKADPFGNLRYTATARNFAPVMAMAADQVIVEAEAVVGLGDLAADDIHTPGPFVDAVVDLAALGPLSAEYGVVRRGQHV